MSSSYPRGWGQPPWTITFQPPPRSLPDEVDFAVIGGGFTGLSAAAWLRRFDPAKSVALLEADSLGAGSSGRTGGMTLAATAADDLPGLGDVLAGFSTILEELDVDCDLTLPGAWEIGRKNTLPDSPISWSDAGNLRAVRQVPGGTIDPGKMISGLAAAADRAGALIFENARVEEMLPAERLCLQVSGRKLLAHRVLFATNAQSLEISGLAGRTQPMFTLALATASLSRAQIEAVGLASGKPFYTIDFPYLWGRLLPGNAVLFGGGWSRPNHWSELAGMDIATGDLAQMLTNNEKRVRDLHPALREVEFTHRWGGPILIGDEWRPVFVRHPDDPRALVCGAYSGHGVALSVYLGRWAAEALLGRRELPSWDPV